MVRRTPPRAGRARQLAMAVALGASLAAPVGAQETFTLGAIVDSLQAAAREVDLSTREPVASGMLDSIATLFRDAGARGFAVGELADAITQRRPSAGTVARWEPERYRLLSQPWFRQAVIVLAQIGNTPLRRHLVAPQFTQARANELLAPLNALGRAVRAAAMANGEEKLRRYEIKYGPDSPRLNLAEVGLNYVAQLWIPALGPTRDGWPSPYEIIAAYRATELTVTESETDKLTARLVSAGQLGIRKYHFRPGWGTGSRLAQLLRPRESSIGAFVMGPRDTPLHRVWGEGARAGAFIGWGTAHLGYVFGPHRRLVLGTGTQLIPYAF
jgi:hypothetical protein